MLVPSLQNRIVASADVSVFAYSDRYSFHHPSLIFSLVDEGVGGEDDEAGSRRQEMG
jgi:hypothetical protein